METATMDRLIEEHIAAEMAGDPVRAVAMYTNDVEHDVVGWPLGPGHGKAEAQGFYTELIEAIHSEQMDPVRRYYGADFCVMEHEWSGTVPGAFLGVAGNGRRIRFRLLHVWEFRDGRISRENVWLDSGAILAQLSGAVDDCAAAPAPAIAR